jgi:hypothetical protein
LLKTPKKSIKIIDIILCLIAIKTITATKNIKYQLWLQRFDIISKEIYVSVKTK